MPEPESQNKWTTQATRKVLSALNRADELGGELRDFLQDKVATDPRYVQARKRIARLLGRSFESRDEAVQKAQVHADKVAAAAAVTPDAATQKATKAAKGFGDPSIKAQIFGKKSCPWSGRAITLLERNKVDFDFVDLEEPEHEAKATPARRRDQADHGPVRLPARQVHRRVQRAVGGRSARPARGRADVGRGAGQGAAPQGRDRVAAQHR